MIDYGGDCEKCESDKIELNYRADINTAYIVFIRKRKKSKSTHFNYRKTYKNISVN